MSRKRRTVDLCECCLKIEADSYTDPFLSYNVTYPIIETFDSVQGEGSCRSFLEKET